MMHGEMAWFAVTGAAVGVLHGSLLWWSAMRGPVAAAITGTARLMIVGLLFLVAVLAHALLPAALGWAVGFGAASIAALARLVR